MYRFLSLIVFIAASSCAPGQIPPPPAAEPTIDNAHITQQQLSGTLQSTLDSLAQAPAPLWVGYTVPAETPYRSGWERSRVTYLESGHSASEDLKQTGTQAAQDSFSVLYRLANGKVDQLRSAGPDETLDPGGLRFVWLRGVSAEDSVATLRTLALARPETRTADAAAFLIALHRSPSAMPALIALAGSGNELHLREKAAFWLANQRGHEGFLAIQTFAHQDGDASFREKLTFDLTLSKDPGAVRELIRMAHEDTAPRVRRQAQFWMAQSCERRGGKLVAGALHNAAEHDPDASVRKQAIFAISRLPQEEATDKLVNLAGSSQDPEVRKQAIFWLGQSNDPKALAFLSSLLTSPNR